MEEDGSYGCRRRLGKILLFATTNSMALAVRTLAVAFAGCVNLALVYTLISR
jgi:hypothetical protein